MITGSDAYLQRIMASGQVSPGWPVEGLSLCSLPRSQRPQAIALDGEGGVFVAWYDDRSVGPTFGTGFDVYVQRVRSDRTLAPGWPTNGAAATLAINGQFPEAIVSDGAGGAYVVWTDERDYPTQNFDIYAQHLTASGTVAAGWPADGLPVCTALGSQGFTKALADGAGGVVVVWSDCRACDGSTSSIDIYGERLLPDGTIASGWSVDGLLLISSRTALDVAPDDAGGFYVCASTLTQFGDALEHWVHRFTFSGTISAGWPAEGVKVCGAAGERNPARVSPDAMGGLLLTWKDYRGPGPAVIFVSRVLPDGTLAPGWTPDGVPVSQIFDGQSDNPDVVADGAGGAYVCWEWTDYATFNDVARVQHLSATGAIGLGWSLYGVPISTSLSQYFPRVVTDGTGGAIVVWEEHGAPPRGGLFAQRFAPDGPTPVLVSLASADATPERVLLNWRGEGAGTLVASVYRRDAAIGWERLGAAEPDGPDRLRYEDRTVQAEARYAYRLGYLDDGVERLSEEAWVEVPPAARFALRGLSPNPSAGEPFVMFSLASTEGASLEVYDLHGRLVFSREVGALGAGVHRLPIGERGRLPAGIYAVRLRQGGLVATSRAVVIR